MKHKTTPMIALTLALFTMTFIGCAESNDPASTGTDQADVALPDGLFIDAAPDGAKPIQLLKASAKEGDEVVVRVIVGGRIKPLVEGRASAAVVDISQFNKCLSEDDHCKTPWDYCCAAPEELNANLANIQLVDADGRVLAADWSGRIKPLSTLVVQGVVGPRPDAKVLTINATGIFIESATP